MAMLEQLLRGAKVVVAKKRGKGRPRLLITPSILRMLRKAWLTGDANYDSVMLWAVCSLCFFRFFRLGELTSPLEHGFDPSVHLSFDDIAVDDKENPTVLQVHLKASKMDPFRTGVDLYVGKTGDELCPVTAMVNYLCKWGGEDGPLFYYSNRKFLTRESLVT